MPYMRPMLAASRALTKPEERVGAPEVSPPPLRLDGLDRLEKTLTTGLSELHGTLKSGVDKLDQAQHAEDIEKHVVKGTLKSLGPAEKEWQWLMRSMEEDEYL